MKQLLTKPKPMKKQPTGKDVKTVSTKAVSESKFKESFSTRISVLILIGTGHSCSTIEHVPSLLSSLT
jgi:hypothetical protein